MTTINAAMWNIKHDKTWNTQVQQIYCCNGNIPSQWETTAQLRYQSFLTHKPTGTKTCHTITSAMPSCMPKNSYKLEMWANAQRDGCPAEYRWRHLFNAAKFGWRPLLECCAVTLPRRETRWNLQGCLKLTKRSQPLVGWSSPYWGDMWRRYCCLTKFFLRLSIHASVVKI